MNLQHSKSALMVCTALTLVTTTSVALAQTATNSGQVTELEQIVVKGKRTAAASAASDTPLATQTNAQDISRKQINSILDLGRTAEVGVNFNRSTGAVNIRGLEGARVVTTVDGIPLAYLNDEVRSVNGGVDTIGFSSLSAVDVVRGGDSSRAGAGALGGVLSLRTLQADDLISDGRDWGGIGKVTYDSSDRSIGSSIAVAKRLDSTSVLFQAGHTRGHERKNQGVVDGYGSSRTVADPADYKKYDLLFKLRHDLASGHRIGLTAEQYYYDKDTDARSIQGMVSGGRGAPAETFAPGNYDSFDVAHRQRLSIDYAFESEESTGWIDAYEASLYWLRQEQIAGYDGIRKVAPLGAIGRKETNEQNSFGLIGNGQKDFDLSGVQHSLRFGHQLTYANMEQYSRGYDNCLPSISACGHLHTNQADTPYAEGYNVGLYLDDKISVDGSSWALIPGVRLDWVDYAPKMTPEYDRNYGDPSLPKGYSDFAISPKLRAEYDISPEVKVYAQWSAAFRAPTMSELYAVYGSRQTYLRMGNPDLESETGNSFDLGISLEQDDIKAKASVYYNRYENFIDTSANLTGTARSDALARFGITGGGSDFRQGVYEKYNIPSAQIWGADFAATKSFDNGLSFSAGFAYANGENRESGKFLQSVAPMKLALGVNYDTDQWGLGANWIGVREARGQTESGYFKTPGYGIVDLSAWYEPEQVKGLRIQAGIQNIFDKKYFDYASVRSKSAPYDLHSEPGRTFKISLTQKF